MKMPKSFNLQIYEDRHNLKYPSKPIKITRKINKWIYFETEFGLCKRDSSNFGRTNYNIHSAINKNNFCIRQLIKIYGDKYDFSKIEYQSTNKKVIIICKKHGEFKAELANTLAGNLICWGCNKVLHSESRRHSIKRFIDKANKIHNFKYDYSKTIYKGCRSKVSIICLIHGEFFQVAFNHLNGSGCTNCGKIKLSQSHSKNPTGWNLTNWIKKSKISKEFDSFKLYIIKCWDNNEMFYKIGRTFNTIKQRFNGNNMPYNYKILQIFKGEAKEIYNLETELKRLNKNNKYLPLINFNGMHECFNSIEYVKNWTKQLN